MANFGKVPDDTNLAKKTGDRIKVQNYLVNMEEATK